MCANSARRQKTIQTSLNAKFGAQSRHRLSQPQRFWQIYESKYDTLEAIVGIMRQSSDNLETLDR
jgi:hypothetical protein